MDFIVFGADWGVHPTTTQHLVTHMTSADRIIWIDSIGMRSPKLTWSDMKRLLIKLINIFKNRKIQNHPIINKVGCPVHLAGFVRISPIVLPFHLNPLARIINTILLKLLIDAAMKKLAVERPFLLSCTPVVCLYLDAFPYRKIAYLRLDDYGKLPGVDPFLIKKTEENIFKHSSVIFATAKNLLPLNEWSDKSYYLPQGVDTKHFAQVQAKPSGKRILGFFGLIAEWLDFELIKNIALATPAWTLEFIGPIRYLPNSIKNIPNIKWKPPVSFSSLPQAITDWTCAWIPFEVSDLTESVNPLKAREYLAAGLATHCTPLPEVEALCAYSELLISNNSKEIVEWMEASFRNDSIERRLSFRESVSGDSWTNRSEKVCKSLIFT